MGKEKKINPVEAKKTIVEIGIKCWQKGWVASNDGNISWRTGNDEILCTPTGVSKGMLTHKHICTVDMDGKLKIKNGQWKPSSEIKMHLRLYRERSDIGGIFHAHPPYSTAHAITGNPLTECILPEIIINTGSVPIVPYGTPSTQEIPDNLNPFIRDYDAWLLENHGALTAGKDPYQAYFRMESVELYAQMLFIAKLLGKINTLDREKVKTLAGLRKKYGIDNKDNIVFPK
jgi:L-fuculose-phosphate aldolase